MSDTVKLIIEISKEHYEANKKLNKKYPYMLSGGETAIAHGIPLDDVKAEIRELRDSWEKDCYHDEAEALNIALKIIDKHISGEGDNK